MYLLFYFIFKREVLSKCSIVCAVEVNDITKLQWG